MSSPGIRIFSRGFTLIEVLVVLGIMVVLVTAIGASLAGGISAWGAARDFNSVETDAMIDLEVMQRDIMNAFPFHDIKFAGTKAAVSFPGLLALRDRGGAGDDEADEEGLVRRIGTVRYFFENETRSLFRHQYPYPEPSSGRKPEPVKVIGGLTGVTIEYYELPSEIGGKGSWVGSWDNVTNFPAQVRVRLMFSKDSSPELITRTFVLPTVTREVEEE